MDRHVVSPLIKQRTARQDARRHRQGMVDQVSVGQEVAGVPHGVANGGTRSERFSQGGERVRFQFVVGVHVLHEGRRRPAQGDVPAHGRPLRRTVCCDGDPVIVCGAAAAQRVQDFVRWSVDLHQPRPLRMPLPTE
nr:hypothetical protein [Streptomyces sp. PTY087I2]